jgi:prophage regulatory protein
MKISATIIEPAVVHATTNGSVQLCDSREVAQKLNEVIFLRLPGVKAVTGLSKSSLYALIRGNIFPAPVRIGPRSVAWVESEVKEWAAERVHASRSATFPPNGKLQPRPALRKTWSSSKKSA